nr:hypothetical protein [Tanacetum cinerariifolium]
MIRIDNDSFTFDIEVPKPSQFDKQASNTTHNEIEEYEWKMSYDEYEKIYAEAVIFINKRLVRLIDVTMEQWLDLKYGNHMTMDENIKKGLKDDGYCNGENLSGAYIVGNTLHYQDLEWYEALKDGKLKEEALLNKSIMERTINEEEESLDET